MESTSITARAREQIRADLGIEPGRLAIAAIAPDESKIDAHRVLFYGGIIELMHQRVAVVVPQAAARVDVAFAFHPNIPNQPQFIVADGPTEPLWPGLDVVFECDHGAEQIHAAGRTAEFETRAEAAGVALRWSVRREHGGILQAGVADTLWWAADLPHGSVRSDPHQEDEATLPA